MSEEKCILSLDIGTTSIRCFIYNKSANIIGRSSLPIKMIYPDDQAVELDPKTLWEDITSVVKDAISHAGVQSDMISAMGISTQRATFTVWDKITGKPFHNFIGWQDTRADHFAQSWNNSYTMKAVRTVSRSIYAVSQKSKFLAAAVIQFRAQHVSMRMLWFLQKYPNIKPLAEQGKVCFGTLETWLIWKLTKGKEYSAEISCASATGLFDPFISEWSSFFCRLLGIPKQMFPPVKDTSAHFGTCDVELFGAAIPICAAVGDQQAAMFGQCCFGPGDLKLTIGTGAFLTLNVGVKPHASVEGFYPVVGWKIGSQVVHLAEGSSNTAGNAIEWLKSMNLIHNAPEANTIAQSVQSSEGVYFVPAFNGIQAPVNDYLACGSIMGITQKTRTPHIVRAVLESLAFRNMQLFESLKAETSLPMNRFVCDGGVSASNLVLQLTADLIGREIYVQSHSEMSALGAAFLAGLHVNYWKNQNELKTLVHVRQKYVPNAQVSADYKRVLSQWWKAAKRSMRWYEEEKC